MPKIPPSSSPRERQGDIDLDPNRIRTQFSDKASAKTNHTEALSVRNTVTKDMKLKIHKTILKTLKKNLKKTDNNARVPMKDLFPEIFYMIPQINH